MPEGYTNHHAKFDFFLSEISENLAFKGKMVLFGLDWFGLVLFFVFLLVKVVLVSIRFKFEISMCLVCPTIEINVCSAYLQNVLVRFFFRKHCGSENTALLCKGSVENNF